MLKKAEGEAQDVVHNADIPANNVVKIINYDEVLPDYMGAMQRLEIVKADPMTVEITIQRVIDGESLKKIAKSWKLPVTRFVKWISDDEKRLAEYEGALRIRADELAHETLEAAAGSIDESTGQPTEVARDKLVVDTNFKLAAMWDRERYGGEKGMGGSGITVVVNREGVMLNKGDDTVTIDG